jgi:PAS domain-containing protein
LESPLTSPPASRPEDALCASAEALQTAHQQMVEILESIGDAFYAVDHAWRFTYINRKAETIWGARRDDLLGKNLWEVFPRSVGSQVHQELLRAARSVSLSRSRCFPMFWAAGSR